jgi:ribosomal-protein-alanine N-acetyltransferase
MSAQLDSVTTYRPMTEADLDGIVAIERRVHAHPWTRGNFADSLAAGYHCWVAERDSQLIAYGIILVAAGEAHLLNLSVESGWQRHGIGTELTGFFVKVAREQGAARIYLEVRPSNVAARALYGRSGFSEVGMRAGYYPASGGREDAVIMEIDLQ